MKLKKRQFTRLKDIAEEVNTSGMFGLGGIKLNKLIADIESVQKAKEVGVETILENPVSSSSIYSFAAGNIFDDQKKAVDDYIRRQGESMVAASTDKSTEFNGGLRDAVEVIKESQKDIQTIRREADESLLNIKKNVYDTEPKIGDVGYFWDTSDYVIYGILHKIQSGYSHPYRAHNSNPYKNFSKTPPELK